MINKVILVGNLTKPPEIKQACLSSIKSKGFERLDAARQVAVYAVVSAFTDAANTFVSVYLNEEPREAVYRHSYMGFDVRNLQLFSSNSDHSRCLFLNRLHKCLDAAQPEFPALSPHFVLSGVQEA